MLRSWLALSLLFSLAFAFPQTPALVTPAAPPATLVLYNGALGTTPDQQQFVFLTQNADDPPGLPVAEQGWANGFTTLTTTVQIGDQAGYLTNPVSPPAILDRQAGFILNFTTQVISETHLNNNRAGLSVIALSDDLLGIELGFWHNRIWAQEGGSPPNLFTQAEGVAFDTTTVNTYTLFIHGSRYILNANGSVILSGPVRDYTAFESQFFSPYKTPNFIFFGDDTSSASARWRFGSASVLVPLQRIFLPLVQK